MLKNATYVVGGIILGVVFVLIVGILEVQRIAMAGGAVVNFNNELIGATPKHPGWLPIATIAVLGTFVAVVIVLGISNLPTRQIYFGSAFFIGTASLVAIAIVRLATEYANPGLADGFTRGIMGWIEKGGMNPVVHVTALLALCMMWLTSTSTSASETPLEGDAAADLEEDATSS